MPEWPLVGRDDELGVLRDLLTGRPPRGVVLAGPHGVGKTRLGHEGVRLAEQAGLATVHVPATQAAAQLPFGALAPLLPVDPPDIGATDDPAEVLSRSASALAERSTDRGLVLFVDDAHLLDDPSATLVHQLAMTGAATVLATVRTGDSPPDAIVALWKDGLAERVEVGPLPAEAIGELLRSVLGGPVDPAVAAELVERSQGNVLFLHELVRGALDEGTLHDDGGIWRLSGPLAPSARLVEIVEARLGDLDERERSLLEIVSYGEPLGPAEIAALADASVAEELERRELLASDVNGRRLMIHLAHPLYGDVIRARTPALRARMIARSLADAAEATGAFRREDKLRVAAWRLEAGGGEPDLLVDGARIARCRHDFALAERLGRAAVDAGAGFEAELLVAQLAGLQGRTDEADGELARLATEAGDDSQRARVAVARFDNSWTGLDPQQILDEAEATIADPRWRDEIETRRISLLLNTRGPRAAADAAQTLLTRATGSALVFASVVGGHALARWGRLDAAREAADRGQAARPTLHGLVAWSPWWHDGTRVVALLYAGRFHEAEELIGTFHQRALDERSLEAQAVFASLSASTVGDRGRVQSALHAAREALALDQQLDRALLVRLDRVHAAVALALAGRAEEAAGELAAIDGLGLPPLYTDEVDLTLARGWVAVAAGDLPGARVCFERAADLGEEIGDLVGASVALHAQARVGQAAVAKEVAERLAGVADRIDGDLAPARAAHVDALARGDAGDLEEASRRFEAMGADLLAAEAAADAAVVRRQAGEAREAVAAERRAALLAERCEDPITPALQRTETRARLTPAERETAVLAASGRSNKDIAEQLFLSPRTVENRLQRVYQKLGITGRADLADALVPDDPGPDPADPGG